MLKSILRTIAAPVAATLLLASSVTASAQVLQPTFLIEGVLQETVGYSARCPSNFGGTIAGHGDSKRMFGKVVFIATDCITPQGPLFNFSDGKFIVMDTSGDQLFAKYSGQFVPTGVGTNFVFSGATFQITGGTGKYRNALGGGTLTGGEDMATGVGTIKLQGHLAISPKTAL